MIFLNNLKMIGRATADAQIKDVGESKVASFRVVNNRLIGKKNGEKQEKATYIDCETWDKRAEYAAERVKKGSIVYIDGRLETDEWKDKTSGEPRSRLKVYVENLQVDTSGQKSQTDTGEPVVAGAKPKTTKSRGKGSDDEGAEGESGGADLPF
jgi:single-strand DNA-binding protein